MKDIKKIKEILLSNKCLGNLLKGESLVSFKGAEEQISCPFHGPDNKPSARYYFESDTVYCFTCRKSWDILRYVKDKHDLDFKSALKYVLERFSIDISYLPEVTDQLDRFSVSSKKITISKKTLFLAKMQDQVTTLRGKASFKAYNELVFRFLKLKNNEVKERFLTDSKDFIDLLKGIYGHAKV